MTDTSETDKESPKHRVTSQYGGALNLQRIFRHAERRESVMKRFNQSRLESDSLRSR